MNKRQENRIREMERTRAEVERAYTEVLRIKESAANGWHSMHDFCSALSVLIDAKKAALAAANPGRRNGASEVAGFAIDQLDLIRDILFV